MYNSHTDVTTVCVTHYALCHSPGWNCWEEILPVQKCLYAAFPALPSQLHISPYLPPCVTQLHSHHSQLDTPCCWQQHRGRKWELPAPSRGSGVLYTLLSLHSTQTATCVCLMGYLVSVFKPATYSQAALNVYAGSLRLVPLTWGSVDSHWLQNKVGWS